MRVGDGAKPGAGRPAAGRPAGSRVEAVRSFTDAVQEPLLFGAIALAAVLGLGFALPRIVRRIRAGIRRRHFAVVNSTSTRPPAARNRAKRGPGGGNRRRSANPLWLLALAAVLAVGFKFQPELLGAGTPLNGTVTHVRDGDTIEVAGTPIRLNGLNCDEIGTPLGDRARHAMQELSAGENVTCTLNGDRTFDREVGRCQLSDGRDLGLVMIEQRLCGRCARHDLLRTYAEAAERARPFLGNEPSYCWWPW